MNLVFLPWKAKKQKKTNSFVPFLGESTARQSAYGSIWPLVSIVDQVSWGMLAVFICAWLSHRGVSKHVIVWISLNWQKNLVKCSFKKIFTPLWNPRPETGLLYNHEIMPLPKDHLPNIICWVPKGKKEPLLCVHYVRNRGVTF